MTTVARNKPAAKSGLVGANLPTLSGLRAICVVLVFVSHMSMQNIFADPGVNQDGQYFFYRLGYAAVGFFFLLSGFVLAWSARPTDTVFTFWRRRLARIVPNNTVTWLVGAVLILTTGGVLTAKTALPGLFMVQTWTPDLMTIASANPVAWSMACEFFFYALFPLLYRLVQRIPERALWVSAGSLVAVIMLVPFVAVLLPETTVFPFVPPLPMNAFWFVYFFPPIRALEFVLGIVLARLVMSGRWFKVGLLPAFGLGLAGYALAVVLPHMHATSTPMLIPLCVLIGAGATADVRGSTSYLRSPQLVWLGNVSFASYMVHYLVVDYAHRMFGHAKWGFAGATLFIVGTFVATMLAAVLLYYLVERPSMRRWSKPRRRPMPARNPEPAPVVTPQTAAATE